MFMIKQYDMYLTPLSRKRLSCYCNINPKI